MSTIGVLVLASAVAVGCRRRGMEALVEPLEPRTSCEDEEDIGVAEPEPPPVTEGPTRRLADVAAQPLEHLRLELTVVRDDEEDGIAVHSTCSVTIAEGIASTVLRPADDPDVEATVPTHPVLNEAILDRLTLGGFGEVGNDAVHPTDGPRVEARLVAEAGGVSFSFEAAGMLAGPAGEIVGALEHTCLDVHRLVARTARDRGL